ncbi:conjugative transposon protein TraM [Flavivirga jejuensis]|uniref:Conjugative transposon protein TraM n=1 Tax=Flavivirga jejuensis TaxID=870487 RepID=A0ABT8WV87_9FLAO|nr:conjugative transposon protein TraM [Flavivirga jejuensis]MDO5977102.1 conjugative transposon protein TraM [Flavivirga jejuensis]
MKIEKNKIVFAIVLVCVVVFIGAYAMLTFGEDEAPIIENNHIPLPKLEDDQIEYDTKLEALEALKEARETNAPSIYDERLLDSTGVYDPMLLQKEKMDMIDSIYNDGRITYTERHFKPIVPDATPGLVQKKEIEIIQEKEIDIKTKERALEHQLFFASNPLENDNLDSNRIDDMIYVRVDGTQTVKKDYRLQMRLTKNALIDDVIYQRNTLLYGFISFKPNRTIITIENINHKAVKLKSFDLQDGSEGINITNTFQAQAGQEVIGDIVDDVNIVGVPQVGGIKKIFQRNNRSVKATIYDNYLLILKTVTTK